MPRVRITFAKTGRAIFISHVDLPEIFGRAARRAHLSPELTQGFSPHPRLALGPPLPVGCAGLAEPAEFWFTSWDDGALARWAASTPQGLDIKSAEVVPEGPSLSKLCLYASYDIAFARAVDEAAAAALIERYLTDAGIYARAQARDGRVLLDASCADGVGPSRFVRAMTEAGVIDGWADVLITRTAIAAAAPSAAHI